MCVYSIKKLTLTAVVIVSNLVFSAHSQAEVLISDDFSTEGNVNFNRTPNIATIDSRNYTKVSTGSSYSTAVSVGDPNYAMMQTNVGGAVSLADGGGFVKPEQLNISTVFHMNTLTNNSPARTGRGVYLGFWSSLPSGSADSMSNMYGVFVNPDSGRLLLWQGATSSTGNPAATLDYSGVWDASAWHTISFNVDISGSETGNVGDIYDFTLDGVEYDWGTTNLFTDANTAYAGFGVSASGVGQTGYFDEWSVSSIPEPMSSSMMMSVVAFCFVVGTSILRRNRR
ncbi:hypothetical protein QEH59_14825 [Coraliomargarita sp. SDUM461004]|uniref:PEP-CTERM sorting domain-containing protein n=1 Tax=Thalassobacterium sedimentorum TaxID=3041258 RepID=A0ABU1ALN4_9BACT|nr:hypothetical protein [Coraliomargarita sp. SDUM461004]MDQ8195706.1 hypothetical protein [Coraliomargarita sp. SDUM461004]